MTVEFLVVCVGGEVEGWFSKGGLAKEYLQMKIIPHTDVDFFLFCFLLAQLNVEMYILMYAHRGVAWLMWRDIFVKHKEYDI